MLKKKSFVYFVYFRIFLVHWEKVEFKSIFSWFWEIKNLNGWSKTLKKKSLNKNSVRDFLTFFYRESNFLTFFLWHFCRRFFSSDIPLGQRSMNGFVRSGFFSELKKKYKHFFFRPADTYFFRLIFKKDVKLEFLFLPTLNF